MVVKNVLDMIGNTPLVDLSPTMGCQIYAKAEFLNLGGSIKDRVAKNMIEAAEKEGKLKKRHDHCGADLRQYGNRSGALRRPHGL